MEAQESGSLWSGVEGAVKKGKVERFSTSQDLSLPPSVVCSSSYSFPFRLVSFLLCLIHIQVPVSSVVVYPLCFPQFFVSLRLPQFLVLQVNSLLELSSLCCLSSLFIFLHFRFLNFVLSFTLSLPRSPSPPPSFLLLLSQHLHLVKLTLHFPFGHILPRPLFLLYLLSHRLFFRFPFLLPPLSCPL